MLYRVRLDLPFDSEADAKLLMNYAKKMSKRATSINDGRDNVEIAYCDIHLCGHDEAKPCQNIERVEVRRLKETLSA